MRGVVVNCLGMLSLSFMVNSVLAQDLVVKVPGGTVITPDTNLTKPGEHGKIAHTNYETFVPDIQQLAFGPIPSGETPASLACIYGLTPPVPGCPINGTTAVPTGGWGTIALVDACDYQFAEEALNTFSRQFGLPQCTSASGCFQLIYASGHAPSCTSWIAEESIDIEWAHAMAPNAKIILVEADTAALPDLLHAEDVAGQMVAAAGGGVISNSWAGPETADELAEDAHFQIPGVVYVASSADSSAPAKYPSSSPYVVSAGGTTIMRSNGLFTEEIAWSSGSPSAAGSSGGPSIYEPRPTFQNSVARIVGTQRGTPDISFDANPKSGVSVFQIDANHHMLWSINGGTSVAAPALAGIIDAANQRAASSQQELNLIYGSARKNYHSYWHDILTGNNGFSCLVGYDLVTGLGSVLGYEGK